MLTVPRKILIASWKESAWKCFSAAANKQTKASQEGAGPVDELQRRIESGDLVADEHQTLVTEALQQIYNKIQGYQPPSSDSGSFFGLFSSKAKRSNAPKGLYIHGSVGGGKTTLMDLFYDCCNDVR